MSVKILMADGDLASLELAKTTTSLLQWCDLVTFADGREAADCLQTEKFDGLIVAVKVPHMDGFEIIQRVKNSRLNSGIPIVMLTVEDDIEIMRRGFKAGVTFFTVMPPNRDRFYRLINAVRGAMENERRRHLRLPYHTSITCNLGDQGGRRFVSESVDISEGGISVRPSGGVEVGQILDLELLLPQLVGPANPAVKRSRNSLFGGRQAPLTGPQKVRAKVRYKSPSGETIGMDFLDMTPAQREVIKRYIAGDN
ncbi:MAG: PilZ domain-containing protein [Acidobacteriota bacterium]|nr:PilZ domain-containing protein [Acidobacteriota bacterium]